MASLPARIVKLYSRIVIKRAPRRPRKLVRHLRRSMNYTPTITLLPRGVRRAPFAAGGLQGERLRVARPECAMLYLHGGGFVAGVTRTYRNLCGRFARDLSCEIILPSYRLAPEHPYPAALDDCVTAYRQLRSEGFPASQIIVAGDSAGGALALGLLLRLRDAGEPLPRCAVLFSPCADLGQRMDSRRRNDASDAMLSKRISDGISDQYAPREVDRHEPYCSPCCADFAGLPPLFVTVSEEELLRDDAYAIEALAKQANGEVELLSRPDLVHVWPVLYPLLPEARQDVARAVDFIRRH